MRLIKVVNHVQSWIRGHRDASPHRLSTPVDVTGAAKTMWQVAPVSLNNAGSHISLDGSRGGTEPSIEFANLTHVTPS